MGMEFDGNKLLSEIRLARETITKRDAKTAQRLDDLEDGVNELHKRLNRPGAEGGSERELERKNAVAMCEDRRSWSVQKSEGGRWQDYKPSSDEL